MGINSQEMFCSSGLPMCMSVGMRVGMCENEAI